MGRQPWSRQSRGLESRQWGHRRNWGPRRRRGRAPCSAGVLQAPGAKYQDFFTTPVKHPTDGVALHYPTLRTNKELGDRRAWDTW